MTDATDPKTEQVRRFRKRPVVIEAIQFRPGPGGNCVEVAEFIGTNEPHEDVYCSPETQWCIQTLEGEIVASAGDYIIRGVQGEFYPCKPDIFEQTYEAVDE